MRGDGKRAGFLVAGTAAGAGVLVEAGAGGLAPTLLEGVTFSGEFGFGPAAGVGAVEVRPGRQLTLKSCVFENNLRSLTLEGGGASAADAFLGVTLTGNDFRAALPVNNGAVLCGANLGAGATALNVGADNLFPGGEACAALVPALGCNLNGPVGFDVPGNDLVLQCQGGRRARAGDAYE